MTARPTHSDPADPREIMAKVIAAGLRDGDWIEIGASLPVARAGALLAHLTHGPNMTLMMAMTETSVRDVPVIEEFEFITDVGATRFAEAHFRHDLLLADQKRRRRRGVFFCGGMQIDRWGNSNLVGIGNDPRRLTVRGPGAVGTCNATANAARYHLVTNSHSPRVLVERCDYISALGYGEGEPGLRAKLGLPNPGPESIITPLCVFAFDDSAGPARLASLHPGVSLEQVQRQTGFAFDSPASVPITAAPSETELATLRGRIDVRGTLREQPPA
jgi:glutaconate CoA-transferase subunit B